MNFFDTHCHIHEADAHYNGDTESRQRWLKGGIADADEVIQAAVRVGVDRMICVGTTLEDSEHAIAFVQTRDHVWASIGIHPHEAKDYVDQPDKLHAFAALVAKPKVVAIGECGLDYFYTHSPKADQIKVLEFQLSLAQKHNIPVIFHVREAFGDLWPILANFPGIRGVIHSFTADTHVMSKVLSHGLYIGLNGIMTFTKNSEQLEAAKTVPNERLLLETDSPFLTPAPYRGKICAPSHITVTAEFLASIRGQSVKELAHYTTTNAQQLFAL